VPIVFAGRAIGKTIMSLFGKVLALLNLVALLAFFYLATVTLQMRQAWSYAALRWDIALDGLPVDKNDVDERGRPRYLNLNEALCNEMVGNPKVDTQEAFLDLRKQELLDRIDGNEVKGTKVAKLVEVLLPLAHTAGEREALRRCLSKPDQRDQEPIFRADVASVLEIYLEPAKEQDYNDAVAKSFAGNLIRAINETSDESASRLETRLSDVQKKDKKDQGAELIKALLSTIREMAPLDSGKTLLAAHFDAAKNPPDSKKTRERDGKRLAIANVLVVLVDVLPTDDEKKKLAEDAKKPADQRSDPSTEPAYKRTQNAIGVQMMSRALNIHAQELLAMNEAVTEARLQERTNFVFQHQSIIQQLLVREYELQEERIKLEEKNAQANVQKRLADAQVEKVRLLKEDLANLNKQTTKALDQLAEEQERAYRLRLRLRDANQINQDMERQIRSLEAKIEADAENR
jgi:hypothetical protein